jgi:hypothetical protein
LVNTTARHPIPRFPAVVAEQVRVVGRGLRREAAVVGIGLAAISLITFAFRLRSGEAVDYEPSGTQLIALVGLLLPFAVWKGEKPYAGGYLWTLPVERRRHALAKVLAGGLWFVIAILLFQLWLLVLALLTGGGVGENETRMLATAGGGHRPVRWTTPAWEWLTPFTSGPILYALGSALVLGVKHPIRTAAGLVFGFVFLAFLSEEVFPGDILRPAVEMVTMGPLGLDAMYSGGAESLSRNAKGPDGREFTSWTGLPGPGRWAGATAIWAACASAALFAALFRHREH